MVTCCHSIIQFHFNLRIELKWIDFVGLRSLRVQFISIRHQFNFNALNWLSGWIEWITPFSAPRFLEFTSVNSIHASLLVHFPSLTSFRHFQLLQSVNFGTFTVYRHHSFHYFSLRSVTFITFTLLASIKVNSVMKTIL